MASIGPYRTAIRSCMVLRFSVARRIQGIYSPQSQDNGMENTTDLVYMWFNCPFYPNFTSQSALDTGLYPGRNSRPRSITYELARCIHDILPSVDTSVRHTILKEWYCSTQTCLSPKLHYPVDRVMLGSGLSPTGQELPCRIRCTGSGIKMNLESASLLLPLVGFIPTILVCWRYAASPNIDVQVQLVAEIYRQSDQAPWFHHYSRLH